MKLFYLLALSALLSYEIWLTEREAENMLKQQIREAYTVLQTPKKPDEMLLRQFEQRAESEIRAFSEKQDRIREEAEKKLLQIRFRGSLLAV